MSSLGFTWVISARDVLQGSLRAPHPCARSAWQGKKGSAAPQRSAYEYRLPSRQCLDQRQHVGGRGICLLLDLRPQPLQGSANSPLLRARCPEGAIDAMPPGTFSRAKSLCFLGKLIETGTLSSALLHQLDALTPHLKYCYVPRRGAATHRGGGVLLFYNADIFEPAPNSWVPPPIPPLEVAGVRLRYRHFPELSFLIGSLYIPPTTSTPSLRVALPSLCATLDETVIFCGDFNATHPTLDNFHLLAPPSPTFTRGSTSSTLDLFLLRGNCSPLTTVTPSLLALSLMERTRRLDPACPAVVRLLAPDPPGHRRYTAPSTLREILRHLDRLRPVPGASSLLPLSGPSILPEESRHADVVRISPCCSLPPADLEPEEEQHWKLEHNRDLFRRLFTQNEFSTADSYFLLRIIFVLFVEQDKGQSKEAEG
eukprot:gene9877-6943_t